MKKLLHLVGYLQRFTKMVHGQRNVNFNVITTNILIPFPVCIGRRSEGIRGRLDIHRICGREQTFEIF